MTITAVPNLDIPFVKQTFFVEGKYCGEVSRPYSWNWSDNPEGYSFARAWAYVCPVCLKNWANISQLDTEYTVIGARCSKHPEPNSVLPAGSLLLSVCGHPADPLMLDYMPIDLLKREVGLHINHRKEQNEP